MAFSNHARKDFNAAISSPPNKLSRLCAVKDKVMIMTYPIMANK